MKKFKVKRVKTRKDHVCYSCRKYIVKESLATYCVSFDESRLDESRLLHGWFCINCVKEGE